MFSDQNDRQLGIHRLTAKDGRLAQTQVLTGSILRQIKEAAEFLKSINQTIEGDRRWPQIALCDALAHCWINCDFAKTETTCVNVSVKYDHMVFQTTSRLPFDASDRKTLTDGFSFCNHPRLTKILCRADFMSPIEAGLTEVFAAYRASLTQPECTCVGKIFRIELPQPEKTMNVEPKIVDLLKSGGVWSRKEMQTAADLSRTTVGRILHKLSAQGRIKSFGKARAVRYQLN